MTPGHHCQRRRTWQWLLTTSTTIAGQPVVYGEEKKLGTFSFSSFKSILNVTELNCDWSIQNLSNRKRIDLGYCPQYPALFYMHKKLYKTLKESRKKNTIGLLFNSLISSYRSQNIICSGVAAGNCLLCFFVCYIQLKRCWYLSDAFAAWHRSPEEATNYKRKESTERDKLQELNYLPQLEKH